MIHKVAAMVVAEPLAARQRPAPQFGNSFDSGWPPVERFPRQMSAPGGRPNTSTPGGLRCGSPAAGQAVISRCVQLPLISAEPDADPSPELIVSLVLQRAHSGAVAKLDEDYLDRGLPTTGHMAGTFDELTAAGLLALAEPDPQGRRRITLRWARCPDGRRPARRADRGIRSHYPPQWRC